MLQEKLSIKNPVRVSDPVPAQPDQATEGSVVLNNLKHLYSVTGCLRQQDGAVLQEKLSIKNPVRVSDPVPAQPDQATEGSVVLNNLKHLYSVTGCLRQQDGAVLQEKLRIKNPVRVSDPVPAQPDQATEGSVVLNNLKHLYSVTGCLRQQDGAVLQEKLRIKNPVREAILFRRSRIKRPKGALF